ncbi:hypothetical protein MBLNU13_g04372t2 [Cladosporium sp. NU13]
MDKPLAVQASTQKATEGNSSDLLSAMSSFTDTIATHGSGYFDFFALPRELRDMIYNRFQRLHPDTPRIREAGQPELMTCQPVMTKLITPLLLGLENWFAYWNSRMPNLDIITVSIYLHLDSIESDGDREELEDALEDFVSVVPKLKELKVIMMDNAMDWNTIERGPTSKKLLVHWIPSGTLKPTLIDCPPRYVETCCQSLVRTSIFDSIDLSSDSGDSIGDTHNSSNRSDHGDHSDHDDVDDSNESDDGYKSENNGEGDDAGNGSHVDADNGDKEYEENGNEDANEDSAEMGSGGVDKTSVSENKQAPSCFGFFGLLPEIRDMIYDQPELLDQDTPLDHFEGMSKLETITVNLYTCRENFEDPHDRDILHETFGRFRSTFRWTFGGGRAH